jgi:Dolichyl-phosphate-mannose-protein mannosyltransferase
VPLFREKTEIVLSILLVASLPLVTPRIEESDAVEYFSYLPSLLLDFDLDFEDEYTDFYEEDPEGRAGFKETFLDRSTATGLKLNFGPIGTALLWSPFYLATHLIVGSEEGMSQPYRTAVTIASALYAAVGLFLCYRLARRFASPFASFAAVVALWWATPVAYYMYVAPGMSHAVSLFAVALFFSLWPWAAAGGPGRWAVWGAAAGLMALVREQDLFFAAAALVAAFAVPERLKKLASFGAAAFVVFLPQLAVYQVLNGAPEPAAEVQRKMIKYSPHFFEVLFSSAHGLFFWSPLLLLFLAGGFWMLKKERHAALVLLAAFAAEVYISGAVDSWTQAGAFGARRFVGATAIFAIWGAFFFEALEPRLRKTGVAALASVFILWNVSLMIQFGLGIMCRQRLVWSQIIHNHVYEVPPRLVSVVSSYLFTRDDLEGSP